jgi:hypothetical protein
MKLADRKAWEGQEEIGRVEHQSKTRRSKQWQVVHGFILS